MLIGDAGEGSQKNLEEIIEKISIKSFSKYSPDEDRIISKGKSIFDVIQDKLVEFWKRNSKPEADPENDSRWIDRNINQGERKLYKNAENLSSIDDDKNFNPKYFAEDCKIQSNLEKFQILQKILSRYDAKNKLIVELRLFKQLEIEEVAEIASTTEGNVRKVICDFRKDCRKSGIKVSKNRLNEYIGGKNNGR